MNYNMIVIFIEFEYINWSGLQEKISEPIMIKDKLLGKMEDKLGDHNLK